MKTLFQRVITVIVFLSLFLTQAAAGAAKPAPAQAPSQDQGGMVHLQGQIMDAPAQWKVRAFNTAGSLASEAYTGSEGRFKFEPLPLDGYHLQVVDKLGHPVELSADTRVDFTSQELAQSPILLLKLDSAPAEPVSVPAEPGPVAIPSASPTPPARIQPGVTGTGSISGTITATVGGAALQYAYAYAYTSRTAADYDYFDYGWTDATGKYTIDSLPDGTYYVKFYDYDYVDSYYNHKASLSVADPVTVSGGGATTGINASLDVGGKITGTVTGAGGALLENAYVYLYDSNTGDEYSYIHLGSTDASGVYEFTGLDAGTYYLKFTMDDYMPVFYNNKTTLASANGIAVTLNSTKTANAALVLGGKVTGTVTAALGGAPLQSVWVYIYDSPTASEYDYFDYAYTDASGVYTINELPTGTYYLGFEKTDYVTSFYNGKPSLAEADAVPVTLGGTVTRNAALHVAGKISGTVTAASGGAALQGARVYAYTSPTADEYDYDKTTTTDAAGKYTLTDLMGTTYYLRFEKTDYLDGYYNDKTSLADADEVSTALDTETKNIDAALDLGGKISGTVTAAAGGAVLEDVDVYAYASPTADDYDYAANATTDASGAYRLTGLPTGTYYLKFEKTDYITSYYNGKATLAAADGVGTAVNTETENINAALNVGGKISGKVTAEVGGAALEDVEVKIYGLELICTKPQWVFIDSATTDASGNYTVFGLNTGQYRAWFDPTSYGVSAAYLDEYYNNKASLSAADLISVVIAQTTDHIDAALVKGGTINGTVTAADGGAVLEDVYIEVDTTSGYYFDSVSTDAAGKYSVTALPAGGYILEFRTYYWTVSAPYAGEYYNDKTDWESANVVNVPAGTEVNGIDAVLAKGARFTGQITAADGGAPLDDVDVYVYDSQGNYVTYGETDATGMYLTAGVRTGSYRLRFVPYSYNGDYLWEYYNDKASLSAADPIAVTAPAQTTINAALMRGGSISGRVTSSLTSGPLEDIYVAALDAEGWDIKWTYTDQDGYYTLHGLPGGGYRVYFEYSICSLNIGIFYHQKPTLATADIVTVTAPANVPNIDGQLPVPAEVHYMECYLPVITR